jgi:hypothetical protein
MFEEQQIEDQQSSRRGMIIVVSIVLVLAIVGTLVYLDSKGYLKSTSTSASTNAPVVVPNADPTKDLRVISTKVDKDATGLVAAWLVDLKNSSQTLTYSHIKYQTTYYGPNESVIGQNTGEIKVTLGPGEEQNVQFNDAQYPENLTLANVKITGATATQ